MRIDVSLIVPAYNEAGTIGLSLERCIEAIRASQQNCQLIVVDDGSVDDTTAIANEVLKDKFADGSYQVLRYEVNRGKGDAIPQHSHRRRQKARFHRRHSRRKNYRACAPSVRDRHKDLAD